MLGAGLAEGLAAIHSSGLVHRDLTHRNVILADDGPRVIDFGIAKALDTVHPSTRIIGTPGFMSPEQARAGQIGPENDVFSLGCVLAYAATGTGPFGGGMADLIIYRIVHEEPNLDGVPADITPLLRSCLAKLPAGRPTLDDILDHLEAPAADATTATCWLPPGITAMITERGTVIRTSTRPSDPEPPEPTGTETGGTAHGDRASRDAGEADPRRPSPEAKPADRRSGTKPDPHPRQPTGRPAGALEQPAATTANAAMAMALPCLLTILVIPFTAVQAIGFGALTSGDAIVRVTMCVVEAVVLATGVRLLFLRKTAGRWLIATGGAGVTLQAVHAIMHFGGGLGRGPLGFLTLTAVAAAAAALMAVLPSTGRWCHRRS